MTGDDRARRRGAVLPFVLLALVLGLASAGAAVVVAREAVRGARGAAAVLEAGARADAGLVLALAEWPARWNAALAPGAGVWREVASPAGPARVRVVRLGGERFGVEAEGRSTAAGSGADGGAVRRRALLVRLRDAALAPAAAVMAGDVVRVLAGAEVVGGDAAPDGWGDCGAPALPGLAAVAAPLVTREAGAGVHGVERTDSAAWIAARDPHVGEDTYAAQAGRAHVTLAGGGPFGPAPVAGHYVAEEPGAEPCALSAASWGEPGRGAGAVAACEGAFPVVRLPDAVVRLAGPARFQGTLLVDGDLEVVGPVRGAGAVVVRGRVDASAGALVLDGALVAGGPVLLGAGSRVRASGCALRAAGRYAAPPVPLARRAWAEVRR